MTHLAKGQTERERTRERRRKAREAGLCSVCMCRPRTAGLSTCEKCRKSQQRRQERAGAKARKAATDKAWRTKRDSERLAARLCIRCGKRPHATGSPRCLTCNDAMLDATARSMEKARIQFAYVMALPPKWEADGEIYDTEQEALAARVFAGCAREDWYVRAIR